MSTAAHDEFEISFDVDRDVAPPDWSASAVVASALVRPTAHLDAHYFDTVDLTLAAQRVAVRHRSGGADAGWHIKRTQDDRRREEHWPAADVARGVPPEVASAVSDLLGGGALVAVARITNDRVVTDLIGHGGEHLAEFCDDHVFGIRLTDGREQVWREWEVELAPRASSWTAAEREDLFSRLTEHLTGPGVAPAAVGSKLARVLGG